MNAGAVYADAWSSLPSDHLTVEELGGPLFAERECDLCDLSEDASEAVLTAGAILQAYLDDATRLPEA